MRTTLYAVYYIGLTTAGISMLVVLFAMGHTETFSLGFILIMAALSGTGALVAAVLQWVGLPAQEDSAKDENSKRGSKSKRGA